MLWWAMLVTTYHQQHNAEQQKVELLSELVISPEGYRLQKQKPSRFKKIWMKWKDKMNEYFLL